MPLSGDARVAMSESLAEKIPFVSRSEIEVGCVEVRVPIEPNRNNVGKMYTGSLFTFAKRPRCAIFASTFGVNTFYPFAKSMDIKYPFPARPDIRDEVRLSQGEALEIAVRAEADGEADSLWAREVKAAGGNVVAVTTNCDQMRSHGE